MTTDYITYCQQLKYAYGNQRYRNSRRNSGIQKLKSHFKQSLKQVTFEKESSKDHSSHSYSIPWALLTAANQWWTKIHRVQSQEMLISWFAFILKWPNAGAGQWAHNSTLEGNNIPNWLCSRGSLHKCWCRSVSSRRLCKQGSRRASLAFYREREMRDQRWPFTADKKISHEKKRGRWMEAAEAGTHGDFKQPLTERQKGEEGQTTWLRYEIDLIE